MSRSCWRTASTRRRRLSRVRWRDIQGSWRRSVVRATGFRQKLFSRRSGSICGSQPGAARPHNRPS